MADPDVGAPFEAALQALRHAGAERADPVEFRRLEALARRIDGQPEGVRRLLEDSLRRGLVACADRLATVRVEAQAGGSGPPVGGRPAPRAGRAASCAPLVRLNRELREAAGGDPGRSPAARAAPVGAAASGVPGADPMTVPLTGVPREPAIVPGEVPWPMLRSVRRFHEAWTLLRAADRVLRAVARGPANAGPLNSERLVLRSLAMMRALSPDYLRHFLAQVDALLVLDETARTALPPPERPARRGRARK